MFPNHNRPAPPHPSNAQNFSSNAVAETCDRIKEEYSILHAQNHSLKLDYEKLMTEKGEVQRHYVMYYEMSYGLNVEVQKQTEIAKRLQTIILQLMHYLSPEQQQQVNVAIDRAKQISIPDLNQIIGTQPGHFPIHHALPTLPGLSQPPPALPPPPNHLPTSSSAGFIGFSQVALAGARMHHQAFPENGPNFTNTTSVAALQKDESRVGEASGSTPFIPASRKCDVRQNLTPPTNRREDFASLHNHHLLNQSGSVSNSNGIGLSGTRGPFHHSLPPQSEKDVQYSNKKRKMEKSEDAEQDCKDLVVDVPCDERVNNSTRTSPRTNGDTRQIPSNSSSSNKSNFNPLNSRKETTAPNSPGSVNSAASGHFLRVKSEKITKDINHHDPSLELSPNAGRSTGARSSGGSPPASRPETSSDNDS